MTFRCRVRVDGREFDAAIEDLDERPVRVEVEGRMVEVWPEEASAPRRAMSPAPRPARDEAPGAPTPRAAAPREAAPGAGAVVAPLPGEIVGVAVAVGAAVQRGDELVRIEAMKMVNVVRAPRPARVAAVRVVVGQAVEQGATLVELDG